MIGLNYLDLFVIAVILIFALLAFRKGFVMACFGFLPTWVALFGTYKLYPFASKSLRGTRLYLSMRDTIFQWLDLENVISDAAVDTQTKLIEGLKLPEFLKNALIDNNNSVVYQVLDVNKIQDYIAGYISNICINILTMILIFIVLWIAVKAILAALNLMAKLPVLSFFNRGCGLLIGAAEGVVVLWILGIALTFFYYNPKFIWLIEMLEQSKIALALYENNFLLFMILKIFT